MDLTDSYHELQRQFCVIARARNPERAQFQNKQIISGLAHRLGPYITANDIVYKAPNFIIHVNGAYVQRNILSERTFQVAGFKLDVLPWSMEQEKTQLPWMPDQAKLERTIEINPLTMLPAPIKNGPHIGPQNLMSDYAARIGTACDLTEPDFSYLLVAELRDYYYSKHAEFCVCKAKASEMAAMVDSCTSAVIADAQSLCHAFQALLATDIDQVQDTLQTIVMSLQGIVGNAATVSSAVFEDMTLISEGPDSIMSFDGYQKLPNLKQVPIAPKYVKRLRVIHAASTREAYGLESSFTIMPTADDRYEIFRTMGIVTKKYIEEPLKSPASIETAATYHSLKAITNWMGYKIMDINYPVLASLMAALHRLSTQMVLLQCIAYNAREHTNQLHAYLGELDEEYSPVENIIGETAQAADAMENFKTTVQKYYHGIVRLGNDFYMAKADYFAQHLDVPSPTTKPRRWLTLQSEDGTYLPPPQP